MTHFEKSQAAKSHSILKWLAFHVTVLLSMGALGATSSTAPLAPSALTATATSTSQVSLSFFDNSNNEQGFVIMRSLNSSTGFSQIATLATNVVRYSDAGLSASTPYYYRVAAFRKVKGKSIFSAYSNLAAVTTLAQTAPPPPPPSTPAPTPIPDPSWVRCASEYGLCSFTGTRQVRYGLDGKYAYKTATGSIACTSDAFGIDPYPNVLKACDYSTTATTATPTPTPAPTPIPSTPAPAPTATPAPPPPPTSTGSTLPDIQVVSQSSVQQLNVPITFGQVFMQGALRPSEGLNGALSNGSIVPLQVNNKATYPDGSVRHAIISTVIPTLSAGQALSMNLVKASSATSTVALAPTELLNSGFTASVNLNIGGVMYSASADALLKAASYKHWLSGSMVNEFLANVPFKTSTGVAHPHLTARFAIRAIAGQSRARVDVTIENAWAYEPGPQNFTYDAQVLVGGQSVYTKSALTHFHHARWHKQFWWGASPQVNLNHNGAYLMASKAVPNYDPTVRISEAGLADLNNRWATSSTGPMGAGILNPGMPTAGGRPDIGPLPQWTAMYLISMDNRAKTATLGTGDLAGSWPIHYRDKNTDRPVSISDYPYMTLLGNPGDAINPATGKSEAFPPCGGDCSTAPYNYNPDSAHQPSLAYVPYLTTGDHYYLEELEFWANWIMLRFNPYYRGFESGTLQQDEIRGQAWSLRTLGQTAFIAPDSDPMKQYFVDRVNNNLNWYNTTYTNAASANKLGVIDGSGQYASGATAYPSPSGPGTGLSPWQDDFFTWAVGYLTELGFANAAPLLKWKATFPVGRMTAAGFCWNDATVYALSVRPSATSPFYTTFADVYQSTMRNSDGTALKNSTGALYLSQPCNSQAQADWRTQRERDNGSGYTWSVGEMDGWAWSIEGYPANMQPAMAVAGTSGVPNAQTAWSIFANRTVKPDYSTAPQWAIVPRP